jgi:hypothetical protein
MKFNPVKHLTNLFIGILYYLYEREEPREEPEKEPSPALVIERVKSLFLCHGVALTQIPRIFPKITLEDIYDDRNLIKKLTPEVLSELATLFNVRQNWLEGVSNQIYEVHISYKRPEIFFSLIKSLKFDYSDFPFRIIKSESEFNRHESRYQPYCFIFFEKIAEIDDEDIYRYYLDGGWDWNHHLCRIQTKAMALSYWEKFKNPITIYSVKSKALDLISQGKLFPQRFLTGSRISDPSLEDYVLTPKQSVVAKEVDELPEVIDFKNEKDFPNFDELVVATSHDEAKDQASLQRHAANVRHEPISELKRQFLKYWFSSNGKFSQIEAARRFHSQLSPDDKKLFSVSNAPNTFENALREYKQFKANPSKENKKKWFEDFDPEN